MLYADDDTDRMKKCSVQELGWKSERRGKRGRGSG